MGTTSLDKLLLYHGGRLIGTAQTALAAFRADSTTTIKASIAMTRKANLKDYLTTHSGYDEGLDPAALFSALLETTSTAPPDGMRTSLQLDIANFWEGGGTGPYSLRAFLSTGTNALDLSQTAIRRLRHLKTHTKAKKMPSASSNLIADTSNPDHSVEPLINYLHNHSIGDIHQVLTREIAEIALCFNIFQASAKTTQALMNAALTKARGPLPAESGRLPHHANIIRSLANQSQATYVTRP